jgi:hypothetical protein
MKIAALASNSFLTYIWYIGIPVDHDFYVLMLKSPVDIFESTLHLVKTVNGSVHYTSLANGGA